MSINWDRLRRDAAREYERTGEGARRRRVASEAAAAAEELAYWATHKPDGEPVPIGVQDPGAIRAAFLAADQAVYVYRGPILLAKLPPSSLWNPVPVADGMKLETKLLSPTRGGYVEGPDWAPGEWTFCGRGHPGE